MSGIDYALIGNTAMISKSYLAKQPVGTTSLIFSFYTGADQTLTITVSDTTVIPDEDSPTMLVRALGRGGASANGNSASYSDVGAGTWYSGAVTEAKALGLLDFAKGGSFKPH